MAIAEQIQHGKITVLQGKALAAEKWSQMLSEDERRANARQAVQAQQAAIQARAAQAAEANQQAMYRQMVVTGASLMQGPPPPLAPPPPPMTPLQPPDTNRYACIRPFGGGVYACPQSPFPTLQPMR